MSTTASTPADAVILNDPSNMAGAYSTALVADVKRALDAWVTHLTGLGTLTVQIDLVNDGQNGLLADTSPTLDAVVGTEDGHTLLESGAVYELSTGTHLSGGSSDITINVNAAYLGQEYLDGGTSVPAGQYDGLSLFEHEIAHGLGFGGETSQTGSLDATYETAWDHDLASIGGREVFTGVNATAANGGALVNITTLNNGEGYAHLANSASDPNADDLMTGLGLPTGVQRSISDVDLAILADVGDPITGMAGTITVGGPARATVVAGTASPIGGFTLADTGAFTSSTLTLTVTDLAGRLSATQAAAATVAVSSNGRVLTMTGSLADVGTELASLGYTASAAGTDTVQVTVVDSFGNIGAGSLVVTTPGAAAASPVVLPAVLSLAATPGAVGPLDAGRSVSFTLATTGPVSVGAAGTVGLTLSDGGTAAFDAAASTPTRLVFTTTVAAGQNTPDLTATGLTLAGGATITGASGGAVSLVVNAATAGAATGIVVDTLAPTAPGLALDAASDTGVSHADRVTDQATPLLDGTANAGSTVVVTDSHDGVSSVLGTVAAGAGGTWSLATPALADGVHALSATATDAAGNRSAPSAVLSVTIDTVAPGIPTLSLAAASDSGVVGDGTTRPATQTLDGTAEAGCIALVYDGTALLGTATASSTGAWSYTASLASGSHLLAATASDAAGNVSARSAPLAVTIDAVAPTAPTLTEEAATVASATPSFSGLAEAGSTVTLLEGAVVVGTAMAASNGAWSATLAAPLAFGDTVLTATATDAAGDVSASSQALDVVRTAPSSASVGVSSAPALGLPGPALVTLNGAAGQADSYTAAAGASFIVVDGGAASVVASADVGGAMTVLGNAGTISFVNGGGSGVVVGDGASALRLSGGLSTSTLVAFAGQAAIRYTGGTGADEIIGGSGAMSLTGGTGGSLLVFGGTGALALTGGAETDTVVGGAGSETIHAGVGAVFAGTGGSALFASGAGTFLAGNVSGDQLRASAAGGDILAAGAGNETLAGAGAAAGDLVFGGSGADSISLGLGEDTFAGGAGGGIVQLGAGSATLYLGTGAATMIAATSGSAGGTDTISGFRVGTDHLGLVGYAKPATLTASGSSTTLGLVDGTRIVLSGVGVTTTAALLG